jgi:hypothetical protein
MLRAHVREMALMFDTHLNVLTSVALQTLYLWQQLWRMCLSQNCSEHDGVTLSDLGVKLGRSVRT